jgi:methyltransferase (TIGR00027 family)
MNKGRPSETAIRIAAHLMGSAREPLFRPLLTHPREPYAEWFVRERSPVLAALWKWGPTRRALYTQYESRTPGAALYILLRKRYVEEAVRAELSAEPAVEQVVALGAGLDPLCLRLAASSPEVRFYEVDHPDTQALKRRALERRCALPANLALLPANLSRDPLEPVLQPAPGFRGDSVSLILAEGLLMYLPPEEVDTLFQAVRAATPSGSRFLFSMVDRAVRRDSSSALARMDRVLAQMGEPLRSDVTREELPRFLETRGFGLGEVADAAELRRRYLDSLHLDLPVVDGELLITARQLS